MKIEKPKNLDPSIYFKPLIDKVAETDLLEAMENSLQTTIELAKEITIEKENYSYASGKWTIKQLYQHIIDCERILAYRVLSIARNEKGCLLGFDEDAYINFDNTANRTFSDIVDDFVICRKSTISLLNSIPETAFDFIGNTNGVDVSARTISWFITAHNSHHIGIIKERYL